ncbi:aquaporin Z [bacterium]|nr:aquaporin Z [bacterium]
MRKYWAELLGTFVLVFGGVGTAVLAGSKVGFLGVALAFGLSLLAMVYVVGPISGCHVNPAVTFGMYLSRKIGGRDALAYAGAQIVGAILGAGLVYLIARGVPGGYSAAVSGLAANGYGAHSPGGYDLLSAFCAEVVLTFFLVVTVLGATDVKTPPGFAGIPIGLVLTLIHLIGIPVTNTSVNPARSIGPALFVGGWALSQLWLFIVAPLVGAAIAVAVYQGIRSSLFVISTREAETAGERERLAAKPRR